MGISTINDDFFGAEPGSAILRARQRARHIGWVLSFE